MISLKIIHVLTIVFIAQLVECLKNFLLFPKDGKRVQKKVNILKELVRSQPGSPETSCSLKFPPGLSPFGTHPELVARAYTNPIS